MSFRRILVVLFVGLMLSLSQAREAGPVDDVEDTPLNHANEGSYSAFPEVNGNKLLYIFWDHIVVHAGRRESRRIVLEELPYSGYYKVDVIAMYSENGPYQEQEEYRLAVVHGPDSVAIGDAIPDQSNPDRTGTVESVDNPKPGYLYVRNSHQYVYLDEEFPQIYFTIGNQKYEEGSKNNSVDFFAIEIVPPPHIMKEPPFTAGSSNTIEWQSVESGLIAEEVKIFDTSSGLAKSMPHHRKSTSSTQSARSKTFEGLSDGHRYGYFVEALLENNQIIRSDTTYSTQDASPPEQVDSLTVNSYWNKYVKLVWQGVQDDVSGVKNYQIVRSESNGMQTTVTIVDIVFADNPCSQGPALEYCYTDTLTDPDAENKVFTYRIDAVDNVNNKRAGKESDVVIEVEQPNLTTDPELALGMYYKGPVVTLSTNIEDLPLPESHFLRFQGARKDVKFFESEFGKDEYFFDSGWIAIKDTSDIIRHTFDLNAVAQDLNFVNGHQYHFRLQLRDIQGNFSEWSDTIAVKPDCFAPTDVTFLSVTPITAPSTDDLKMEGWMKITWGGAVDKVSGIKNYVLHRDVAGTMESIVVIEPSYVDSFRAIGYNDSVAYRVLSVDNVGNVRSVTNHHVSAWCQAPPEIEYISSEGVGDDGVNYTTRPLVKVIVGLQNFNFLDDIAELVVSYNENRVVVPSEEIQEHVELLVPLSTVDKVYKISARAIFRNKATSLWAEPDSIRRVPNVEASNEPNKRKDKELAIRNFPNPFNPTTQISYTLKEDAHVLVQVYNVQGRLIQTLTDGFEKEGSHGVIWSGVDMDGHAVASGLYYYRVSIKPDDSPEISKIQSMLLLK